MKLRKKYILPYIFIFFTSMFYIIKNSVLGFRGIEIALIIGICAGMLHVFLAFRKTKKNQAIVIGLFAIITIYAARSSDTRMIVSFICILVAEYTDLDRMVRALLYSHMLFFIIAMIAGGTGHINSVGMHVAVIMSLYICHKGLPLTKRKAMLLWLAYIACAIYTKSGTFVISMGTGLLLATFYREGIIRKILRSRVVYGIFPIVLLTNVLLCTMIAPHYFPWVRRLGFVYEMLRKLAMIVDGVASSRIVLGAESLHRFGISVLGGNIYYETMFDGYSYFQVDSGMLWLLQGWGILMTLVLMVLFTYMMGRLQQKKLYEYIIMAIVICLISLNEDVLVSVLFNMMFFILGNMLGFRDNMTRRMNHGYT